jgi:glycosyltransferase involved in cell wall biosynthesis
MAHPTPQVSVIVPAYNAAAHIAEALESVQAQTVENWEIVVCDDGSSDDTATIAARFGERVRVVSSPHNEGLARARNRAIREARGELLALLDADDRWLPCYLERQLAQLEAAPSQETVGVVSCNAYLQDDSGRLPGTYADRFGYAGDVTIEQLLDISPVFISAMIPRAALDDVGLFDPDLRSCEDLDLWLRLVEAGYRVISTREPLVVYRLSPGQLSAKPVAMAQAREAVYRRALDRGALTAPQRRAAERAIRRERAAGAAASIAGELREHRMPSAQTLSSVPLMARVLVENPSRWWRWVRRSRETPTGP